MEKAAILYRDDGLADTRVRGEKLADLELEVIGRVLGARGRVLDLGCGRGRGAVYFALRGLGTVGVDIDAPTLKHARRLEEENGVSCDFVRADARQLCFRDQAFDYVISFGSMLSEKYRLWMERADRVAAIFETVRVLTDDGTVLISFVHRYWSVRGFLGFLKHYLVWASEKIRGIRTEFGDYTEDIGGTPVRFHAFTIGEARSYFPTNSVRLIVHAGNMRPFVDWFFIIATKG